MSDRNVSPARLEAISDGVIAVILTIMVLELHPPEVATIPAMIRLWPQFAIYFISFLVVATLWVNHRYLFSLMRRVDERVLWSNMALLFMLSLVPFSTAFVGQSRLAALSTAVYAVVLLLVGLAFWSLAMGLEAQYEPGDEPAAFAPRQKLINTAAVVAYALAIPVSFLNPVAALGLIVAPSLMYVTRLTRPN
ncbi:MAG: TMEM175 family protein [Phenylobacterium sp.]